MKNSFLGGKVWDKFQEKLQDHVQAGGGYHDHDRAMIATVVDDAVWEISWIMMGTWSEYEAMAIMEYKKELFW